MKWPCKNRSPYLATLSESSNVVVLIKYEATGWNFSMRWHILSSEDHAPPNSRPLQHDVLRRVAFAIGNVLETNKIIKVPFILLEKRKNIEFHM